MYTFSKLQMNICSICPRYSSFHNQQLLSQAMADSLERALSPFISVLRIMCSAVIHVYEERTVLSH